MSNPFTDVDLHIAFEWLRSVALANDGYHVKYADALLSDIAATHAELARLRAAEREVRDDEARECADLCELLCPLQDGDIGTEYELHHTSAFLKAKEAIERRIAGRGKA